MNKKRVVFAIVLFIVFGLFAYTFANPRNNNNENTNNGEIVTPDDDNKEKTPVTPEEEQEEPTREENRNNNNNAVNNNTNNNNNNTANNNEREEEPVVVVDLTDDKLKAIEEINNYKKDYEYSEDNQTKHDKLIDEYTDKINDSTTKEEINNLVDEAKEEIDKLIKEDLDAYKDEAKKEIDEYKDELKITTDVSKLIDEAKEEIDNAETKEAIDKIVEDTKKALDDVKELEDYKNNAKDELDNYKKDEKYTEENQEVVNNIKEDGKDDIDNATTKEEVDKILEEAKEEIDKVKVLTYKVTFVDFKGNETVVEVEHDTLVTAPVISAKVVSKDITYGFAGWDKDLTKVVTSDMVVTAKYDVIKVEANIYMLHDGIAIPANAASAGKENYDHVGKIELDLNKAAVKKELLSVIKKNNTKNLTTDEETIKSYVVGNLPYSDNTEYVYNYYVLNYEKGDGFHIDFNRNENKAPVITLDGETYIEVVEQKGHYDFTKGFSVSDDHTALTNKDVEIKIMKFDRSEVEKINYEKVGTYVIYYTATDAEGNKTTVTRTVKVVANNAPVITLEGKTYIEVIEQKGHYDLTKGFSVSDDHTALTNKDVEIKIVKNKVAEVKSVNYEYPGTYVISYTATDEQGKSTTVSRTVKVVKNTVESISLNRNNDTYTYGDSLNKDLKVIATYKNNTTKEITEFDIEKFDTKVLGSHTATVTYEGKTAEYNYTVVNKLSRIELSNNNVTYKYDAKLNLTVDAYYLDGTKEENVNYSIEGFDTKVLGSNTATVTFGTETAEYNYTVENYITKLELTRNNDTYDVGNSIKNDIKVEATYANGAKDDSVAFTYNANEFKYNCIRNNIKI